MKKLISSLLLIFFLQNFTFGNIAQPGMWQAGGMGNFSLLYAQDSSAFQKIQMINERVSVLLHPGFAIVKGEYWMKNDTDSTLTIKTGYPINSSAESNSRTLMQISFDELYGLKVLVNDMETPLLKEQKDDNWYVWNNTFSKNATTKIVVYFLMNTNQAQVSQGYTKDYSNGFVYLLETGAIWKQPILKGEIRIQAKDDLRIKNIRGAFPQDFFNINSSQKILQGQFTNLSPVAENNIVISYGDQLNNFDFKKILTQQTKYFSEVDKLSNLDLGALEFTPHHFDDPFEIPSFDGIRPTGLFSWITLIFYFIIALFSALVLFFTYKRFFKTKT
ncbi:MAG: hypothetical protein AB8H03_20650 [Saprospiraceae bacterium]